MKGSLITVAVFAAGCIAGYSGLVPADILGDGAPMVILRILMLLVGVSIGCDPNIRKIIGTVDFRILLLPLATMAGTLLFTALASLLLSKWSLADCLAVGSGFGYYSLSSVLISEYKAASLGAQLAAELAAVALMTNIFRELMALVGTPLLYRIFGPFAPISSAGVTSVDVALPVIARTAGNAIVPYSIVHGVIVDMCTPLLVTFFCSL